MVKRHLQKNNITGAVVAVIVWQLDLQVPMCSRLGQGVEHHVIKLVGDMWQVGGFRRVLLLSPPIKRTATIWLKY